MSNNTNNVPDLNIAHDEKGNPIWGGGSADLFSDRNLDEMQRAYSHRIAFRCFKFLFWFCFILSFALFFAYIETKYIFVLICSYGALAAFMGVYIYYAVKTSSKGVMDELLTEKFNKPYLMWVYAVCLTLIILTYVYKGIRNGDWDYLLMLPFLLAAYSTNIVLTICSKRNKKAAEEQEE